MVVHIFSVAFTAGLLYLAVPGKDLFSWHPTCMAVGYVLLVLQAVMVFSRESSLFPNAGRSEKQTLHAILNGFGFVSILFGAAAVYLNKEVNSRKHFTTWHGRFGLATVIFTVGAMVGGIVNKNSQSFKGLIRPAKIRIYHATAGMLVFVLAMTTVVLATYSNWFKNRVGGWAARIAMWIPLVLAIVVMRQVSQAYIPRMFEPRESDLDAKARMVQEKVDAKLKKAKEKKLQKQLEAEARAKAEQEKEEGSSEEESVVEESGDGAKVKAE